ncbi:MAG: pantothenate kinase [Legionellales bacterium]|nr:pantothenate kinase [Legionellales bacterium]|tara:strand:- start:51 stop:812 length:762 start_codon:yes stop_codon:yes gene_type:complete
MILCLDIGNTQIFGGVFVGDEIKLRFRHQSKLGSSSDQLGIFLKSVLRENGLRTDEISQIALCSVVPSMDYSIRSACVKYFDIEPFVLESGADVGLNVKYYNPYDVGTDRIANAIAATHAYPNQDLIIIDFGTATTICAVAKNKDYLGGVILPGMRLSMEALQSKAAKLSPVEIVKPRKTLGLSPAESIQSGLFFGQLAMIEDITARITAEAFIESPVVIGTGGFAHLFADEGLFATIDGDLVLKGLKLALER